MSEAILSSVSISLFFVGGWDDDYNGHDEILELVDKEWKQVATMQTARSAHAVSIINNKEYWQYCN